MKTAYPTFIKQDGKYYLVYVPDMDIYTEGFSFYDAIKMARDAIGGMALEYKEDGDELPKASDMDEAMKKAKSTANEELDFSDSILTYVDVDTEEYLRKLNNRAVKKNCTLPYWLNEKAEAQGINFSRVLQDALIAIVGEG